ncbi:hypothetical protein PV04_10553 [Phialophora macrospora]|uniref:Heterokaryon incompatibility domain-containing protein n=1 Tax=Phialophora macrospora TaxID=1851006 RepID=A0A0D2F390_9EURO|nr:hypothetical protein PV04_10553 [Phialophora macrospora]
MEHLLIPATATHINIPYVGIEEFETDRLARVDILENFKGYLDRRGWQRDLQTAELSFENRTPDEILQSLQTWLYFGCLISVFRRVGIIVGTGTFLEDRYSNSPPHRERFVRTTRLHSLMAEWARREGFATGPVVHGDFANPKYLRGENLKEMLNFTFWYLQMYCRQSDAMVEPHKSRMQLVELAIMAMGESLCSALVEIYGYQDKEMPTWGPSPVLKALLRQNGWCISDSPFFPESMTRAAISADYYFGGLVCPRSERDHSTCTDTICSEYLKVIEPGTYKQAHASPPCSCARVAVPSVALRLVAQKHIPVIRWDGTKMHVSEGSPSSLYVAISHVWSDGLGTDYKNNALFECQLSRIQSLVNKLYRPQPPSPSMASSTTTRTDPDRMVPFWIDSLCVPVGAGKEDLRTQAIRQMAEVYQRADRVLVLDSSLVKLPCSANIVDKTVQIHLSNWHHRLWTMQEGQLARNLFFQFQDGAESFHDMGHATLQSLDRRAPEDLCSPVQLLCATELAAFYRLFDSSSSPHGDDHDITARLRSCAKYLRSRQTSRSEDESVCMANILNLDAGKVLDSQGAVKRMARFYDLVGRFDPRIIFHQLPSLPYEGYRWAPRSFLHQLSDLISIREGSLIDDNSSPTWLIPGGGGLPVRYPGFELIGSGALRPGSSTLVRGSIFAGQQQQPSWEHSPWWACTYRLELTGMLSDNGDEADAVVLDANSGLRYAVILPCDLCPGNLPIPGVMGIVDSNVPQHPMAFGGTPWTTWTTNGTPRDQRPCYSTPTGIPIRYVGRVHVSLPLQGSIPPMLFVPTAMAYAPQQEWCIR